MKSSLPFFYIIVILLAIGSSRASAQLIPWRADYLLSWGDFQGPCPHNGYAAECDYDYLYVPKCGRDGTITVTVTCSFNKQKAWKDPSVKLTLQLLLHEQLHFYAAETYARKMRQAFSNYTASHKRSAGMDNDLKQIFNKYMKEGEDYQAEYDKATNHGLIKEAQETWRKKIVADLQELGAFEVKRA